MEPHYLNVPGIEWEYKETDRNTGRSARKVYPVPLYLNPEEPTDQTEQGMVVVSDKYDPAHPRDVIFEGPPTPNMEALDDEAKAISDKERSKWIHPIEALNMTYSESRLSEFEREIAQIMAKSAGEKPTAPPNLSLGGVSPADFEKLQQQVAMLMDRNAQLEATLASAPKRRV
jgi:hypothetical protein